jgi:hypothetical protein
VLEARTEFVWLELSRTEIDEASDVETNVDIGRTVELSKLLDASEEDSTIEELISEDTIEDESMKVGLARLLEAIVEDNNTELDSRV